MKLRIYIDTSVIGGYFDEEFDEDTKEFFKQVENKKFEIYFSEVNETELSLAPENIRELKYRIPQDCYHYLELTEEIGELANEYINSKALGPSSLNDAFHIAFATVHRLDVLISWNFKHIVNYNKIRLFNSINLKLGYPTIDLRTPREIIDYEE